MTMILLAILLALLGIIYGLIRWEMFKYHECLRVGHSKTYCVLMIDSK